MADLCFLTRRPLPGAQARKRSKGALAELIGVCYYTNLPRQEEVRAKNTRAWPPGRVACMFMCMLKLQLLMTDELKDGRQRRLHSRANYLTNTAVWIFIFFKGK